MKRLVLPLPHGRVFSGEQREVCLSQDEGLYAPIMH
jgi:hypothetical protein